ncbi:MAG: ABC transporter substrate-binding protein [Gammaproteobacteria bacterium]|nr:ABC transporter substrate-binding protein [Gammaproteobacteria bacterium]
MSLNLCADQLIMQLADTEQILGLTELSRDEAGSYYFQRAQSLPVSNATAEELLALNPDLVVAGTYTTQHTVRMLTELGLRIETLPIANSVDQLLDNLEKMGDWLGQHQRARREIEEIKKRLASLTPSSGQRPLAAVYDPNGYTVGDQTLRGHMLTLAGWDNLAAQQGVQYFGSMSLETLIVNAPDAIVESPYSPGTWSRAQRLTRHPALGVQGINPKVITLPSRSTICAGPWTLDVIEQLQAERLMLETPGA